jgi:hypothetical protein
VAGTFIADLSCADQIVEAPYECPLPQFLASWLLAFTGKKPHYRLFQISGEPKEIRVLSEGRSSAKVRFNSLSEIGISGSRCRTKATASLIGKISEPGVRRRAEFYYQQLDALRPLRRQVRRDLLAESKKHQAWKRLCQIPSIGPTPHRFRTKRQLWTYSGFGIETRSSADHRRVEGQLQRAKKQISIRGLNQNCNHDLKNLFKGAAILASSKPGPFQEFYTALLTKGIRPEMARLTLARKIATIALIVWKRGACFDAQHLKPQTA